MQRASSSPWGPVLVGCSDGHQRSRSGAAGRFRFLGRRPSGPGGSSCSRGRRDLGGGLGSAAAAAAAGQEAGADGAGAEHEQDAVGAALERVSDALRGEGAGLGREERGPGVLAAGVLATPTWLSLARPGTPTGQPRILIRPLGILAPPLLP